jgi:surface polysaccharide O-acyltransferase-like enzyme
MKRNTGLDYLKIIACFAVVVLHVTGMAPVPGSGYSLQDTLYYLAGFAVPVFFMVNGYLLLSKAELGYRYIFKKILTILAVVFSWNVIIFLEKLIVERKTTDLMTATYRSLIQGDYFWQFWFFGSLILIYLALPLIHRAFKKLKPAVVMTGVLVAVCLAIDITSIVRSSMGLSIVQVHVRQTFRLWTWVAYFLLGGLLGKKQVQEAVLKRFGVALNWVVLVGSLVVISIYQYNMSFIYRDTRAECFYDNIFTFIYAVSLFLLFIRRDYSKSKETVISLVSGNVMGIYILHVTVITSLTTLVFKTHTQASDVLLMVAVFTVSLAASHLIGKVPLVGRLISL